MLVSGPSHTIPYPIIWGCRQAKSHMMAYDKQLTNFTLMYDEKDYLVNGHEEVDPHNIYLYIHYNVISLRAL